MQNSSQDSLLSSMMFLDSLDESAGTNDVEPSLLLIKERASSSRILKAFVPSSRPALVKYHSRT